MDRIPENITTLDELIPAAWERGMDVSLITWTKDRRRQTLEASLRLTVGVMQHCVGDGGCVREATAKDDNDPVADAEADEKTTLPEMVRSVVQQANAYIDQLNKRQTFTLHA